MPDNLPPARGAAPAPFALPGASVLELAGGDAAAFAQSQFMNDVAGLADGQWQWNGWLTPKGRLVALFALLRLDPGRFWLVLPDFPADALAARLRRFVFRSKVAASPLDLACAGMLAPPVRAAGRTFARDDGEGVELDMGSPGAPRTLSIGPGPFPGDAEAVRRWRVEDLRHGLPRLPAAMSEQFTPQMLSLQRLQAFSVKKGCYPGQEIVARTHFLGQSKRGLALLESDRELPVGAEVVDAGRALGTVVATAEADEAHLALAVLPIERPASLHVGDSPVRERALVDGLAR